MPSLGRLNPFGLAKETTRMTGQTSPTVFLPYSSIETNPMNKYQASNEAIGVRHNLTNNELLNQWQEGKLDGMLNTDTIGYLMSFLFGSISSVQTGTTGAYTHTFTVNNNVQLPSFSAFYQRGDVGWLRARGACLEDIDISSDMSNDAKYTSAIKAIQEENVSAQTAVYTDTKSHNLLSRHCTVRYATTVSGLSAGTTFDVQKVNIKMKNNLHVDFALGTPYGVDIFAKQNEPEITFTAVLKSNVFDTLFKTGGKLAMSFEWQNFLAVSLGTSTLKPLLRFEVAPSIIEIKNKTGINDIISFDATIKPEYSYSDSLGIRAILQNLITGY